MSNPDLEIVTEDADAPAPDSPPITTTRTVSIAVYLMLIALAGLLGFDNWRTGISWEADGPQAGYFPFYLSVLLAAASLFGLVSILTEANSGETFVTRDQFRRVMQVFVPTLCSVS